MQCSTMLGRQHGSSAAARHSSACIPGNARGVIARLPVGAPAAIRSAAAACRPLTPAAAANDSAASTSRAAAEPVVKITVQPGDGAAPVTIDCPSGEQLRYALLENKVDLYTTWGKVWQCGGVGQCGTCIVQITEGADLLTERNETEQKKLRGKPDSLRLACQTIVGDGTNTGSVTLVTKPK